MLMLLLLSAGPVAGKLKPDLQITSIYKTRDCRLAITVRNNGPGKLPDEVYTIHHPKSAGVYIFIEEANKPIYEQTIWRFDKARKLQKKGGKFTFVFPPKITSSAHVWAKVDRHDVVEEARENNNKRDRKFPICSPDPSAAGYIGKPAIGQKDSISNINFTPKSPSKLSPMQEVKIRFDYFTNEQQGVFILVNPMFQGTSPGYITPPALLKPGGWGKGETYFTFGKGPEMVDAVRFQMLNSTRKKIYEKIVKVKYDFRTNHIVARPPQRVFLDFSGARLVYVTSSKTIRIQARNIVLSKGEDWESVKLEPHIYHLRQKYWNNFFWMVDTTLKKAMRVSGTFGQTDIYKVALIQGISVQVVGGGSGSPPQRFVLHFSKTYLEYKPGPGSVQVITENSVLSSHDNWRDCNMSANIIHIKKKVWKGFFWKINAAEKKAYKITGGSFCTSSGSATPLPVDVRVLR